MQAVPWVDVAVLAADFDLVAISGHKFGGPKGVGVLVVRGGVALDAEIEGGGQERGMRAGTVNVAGAVALATALRITHERRTEETARIAALRDRLEAGLIAAIPDAFVNGARDHRTAGHLHIGFPGVESEALLVLLDQRGIVRRRGIVVLVGRDRDLPRARGDGHGPRRGERVDPAQPRVRVDRGRRRPRAGGHPGDRRAAANAGPARESTGCSSR